MLGLASSNMSREFYRFTKALGECRSKEEEERVVLSEISALKSLVLVKDVHRERRKEYLVRAVYVEMLGFEAPFAHIHAINMAQERSLVCKKAGYWACRQLLKPQSELMLLLINTIQKDLQSPNFADIVCALQCVCDLVNRDMIPTILPCVLRCLEVDNEHVRKHAMMAVRSFNEFDSTCVENLCGIIERGICDPSPAVMTCTLSLLQDEIATRPRGYRHLVPSLVSILNQIVDRRLNNAYDYHRVPAPWTQIAIVSIFGIMGKGDRRLSSQMFECLQSVVQHAEILPPAASVIANAIIYECVKTVSMISPRESLATMCSISVSRMLGSENNNLRYAGIAGLGILVGLNMSYAAENQLVVVSCLEDRDETIRRRTLDLLYRMTNSKNVTTIVGCFLGHLRTKCERYWRSELVSKISLLCEKFAPSATWYMETVLDLMMICPDLVKDELLFSTVNVLKENSGDVAFRRAVLRQVADLVKRADVLPEIVVKVVSWVYANCALCPDDVSGGECDGDDLTVAPGANCGVDGNDVELGMSNAAENDVADATVDTDETSHNDESHKPSDHATEVPEANQTGVGDGGAADEATDSPAENSATASDSTLSTGRSGQSEAGELAAANFDDYIDILLQFVLRYRQNNSTVCWVLGCMRTLIIANDYKVPDAVVSVLSQLECSNCTEVTQRCKEIRSLCDLRPQLNLRRNDYDSKLTFLENYVQTRIAGGARSYSKPSSEVASESAPAHLSPVPELRFEPYAMKPSQMSEYRETLTTEDLVNEEIICSDVPRSWGPSGYVDKKALQADDDDDTKVDPSAAPYLSGITGAAPADADRTRPTVVEPSIDMSILSLGSRAPKPAEPKGYVWKKPEPRLVSREQIQMARALFQGLDCSDEADDPSTASN
ncbi:adaptin N terminal region domain containing protein, putative [Babesia bigemina]|uniref:Adaptin N terminal region domain containing protein, putative n=1 Tax=Babesia bigemina TaxID=5866 RepID=A0A061DC75_BABBI|nr:adaptin N terminal region domain containing protein, putative [Babesia bigemina]CDR96554.1 adaptin N terminal region domain containing protein, putative [Babesia bigemina]|eukprot:XP_012768740.1 adaptin N terminal region domain containing protein, putative [Babesia bigemina]